jgi:hypothetical protein
MNEILLFIVVMTVVLGRLPVSKIKAIGNFFKQILPRLPKKWW